MQSALETYVERKLAGEPDQLDAPLASAHGLLNRFHLKSQTAGQADGAAEAHE